LSLVIGNDASGGYALMTGYLSWMLWNLFLAVIPVALGYAAAALGRSLQAQRARWLWIGLAPLLLLWLVFLPNSCYLFTEPVHLLSRVERENLWSRARQEPDAALRLGLWTGVSLVYFAAGAVTFALSIRPMRAWGRSAGLGSLRWTAPFFLLMALGVYLGRVVRLNSWDLFTRPARVLEAVTSLVDRPVLLLALVLFSFFLWLAYEVADIWVDGLGARWQRRTC
jgi:uncharacterized membrane protein